MNRFYRLSLCGSMTAAALSVASFYYSVFPSRSHEGADTLHPLETERSVGAVIAAQKMVVPFVIENKSCEKRVVLGASGTCGRRGCIDARSLPRDVPASGEAVIAVEVSIPVQTGHFSLMITLFTDSPNQLRIPLLVKGNVVPASDTRNMQNVPRSAEDSGGDAMLVLAPTEGPDGGRTANHPVAARRSPQDEGP